MREDLIIVMCLYLDLQAYILNYSQLRDESATDQLINILRDQISAKCRHFLRHTRQFIKDYPRFFKNDSKQTMWIGNIDVIQQVAKVINDIEYNKDSMY